MLKLGRISTPYVLEFCFFQTEKVPPKFVSDSDKITIATYTGDLEHEANSRGYMFKFKRISETEANQMKREMTMQEW